MHESYKWNPFNKLNKSKNSNFFTIFQSNTKMTHRIPAAFFLHYIDIKPDCFISCVMVFDDSKRNLIFSSIENFLFQTWPSKNRELIIYYQAKQKEKIENFLDSHKLNEQIKFIQTNEINNKDKIFTEFLEKAKGNYICSWTLNTWFSQYRLSIQFQYLNEQRLERCHISPFTIGFPIQKNFQIVCELEIKNWFETTIFQKKQAVTNKVYQQALNEPTLMLEVFDKDEEEKFKIRLSTLKKIKCLASSMQLNELGRIYFRFIKNEWTLCSTRRKKNLFFEFRIRVLSNYWWH